MKKIIHFDLDYFFAQVELLERPQLRDKPVAIGGRGRRGVLSTCNYVARKYGIKSAMPTFIALEKCPQLILLKSNFDKYKYFSKKVFDVFYEYTDRVQVVSVDEAYLDVTDCTLFDNCATEIAREIKAKIFERTGLTGSAGVSYNKLLAKIASEYHKPDGLFVISPRVFDLIGGSLKVSSINGVGKVMQGKLSSLKIETFGDLQKFSKLDLINIFGNFGGVLYDYSRGVDNREIKTDSIRKSLSVERTFNENLMDELKLRSQLANCYEEFIRRMERYSDAAIKSCFVKIKYSDFTQTTIESINNNFDIKVFQELFGRRFAQRADPVRLIGLGVKFNVGGEISQLKLI